MAKTAPVDPVLIRFRSALDEVYGGRLERVVLYGSRARGDARPDSDYDVAVFLRDIADRAQEMNRLADLATAILYDVGGVIHALPYRAGAYNERTPLMHEVRQDGLDL
jgi:predicted nucleotidyltransferase